jgi:hypothetical protein
MPFGGYSENGIRIHIKNEAGKTFELKTEDTVGVGIGEENSDDELEILKTKDIKADATISLYGKKEAEDGSRVLYLNSKDEHKNLLIFLFELDPKNGRQLYLKSVTQGDGIADANIGLFEEIDGGGNNYQLLIGEDKRSIEVFENRQKMHSPNGQQEKLQKVEISVAR